MRAIIVLVFVGSALVGHSTSSRIVGGTDTTVGQNPYMVNMQFGFFGTGYSQRCGGALIRETTVLSAAHCYVEWPIAWWRACLATSLRSFCVIAHTLSRITLHASYNNPTMDNDLAIVHFRNAAVLSQTIQLIGIAGPNYILPDGTSITALGWGLTQHQGLPSEQLQRVDLNIINQQLCAERYAYLKTQPGYENGPSISDGMMCVGILSVGGKDTCEGDSGGPMVHNGNVVVGVTSWRYRCADDFYPSVLARVSYFSDWIVSNS